MQAVDELATCPLVALLSSEAAQEMASKNELNLGDLLLPFSCSEISIKDPLGQLVSHKLCLDIRDIRRKGFLLENTVFRFVLQESILEHSAETGYKYDGQSILSKAFYPTFSYWFEPAEHEFLRAYIACIFIVSTSEKDPLKSVEELELELRQEQQATGSKRISPAYCSVPKWFFQQSLYKYYVLMHDTSGYGPKGDSRHTQLFESFCDRYGKNNCHFLCINSTNPMKAASDVMPNLWGPILARHTRGLLSGIESAKKNLLSSPKSTSNTESNGPAASSCSDASSLPRGISSTSSSQLFTTSNLIALQQSPSFFAHQSTNKSFIPPNTLQNLSYAQVVEGTSMEQPDQTKVVPKIPIYGQCLDVEDRQRLRLMMEDLITKLIPFVEQQLFELYENLANRKSLAKKTFSNMRKWLGATANVVGTLNAEQQQQSSSVCYALESIECQMRQMADLAFSFGLYNFSYQIYQSLKKEFANDQAWLHHAGALEMAAMASFLNDWKQFVDQPECSSTKTIGTLKKQYPQRYMDNAIHYYATVCRQPMLALRSLMNNTKILTLLELYEDAAQQMISVGTSLQLNSELIDAIVLEHAARLYFLAGNRRRKVSFYLATAAIRISRIYERISQQNPSDIERMRINRRNLLRNLYEEVLHTSTIANNGWRWAEDYLLSLYMSCFVN